MKPTTNVFECEFCGKTGDERAIAYHEVECKKAKQKRDGEIR